MKIADCVSAITGGASGLGRATAEKFAGMGGKVAIFDLNEEAGNALADALGDRAIFIKLDVTDADAVAAALATVVDRFGALHACLNYAGIGNAIKTLGKNGPFPLDAFNKILQVNLVGTFNVLRLAAEQMAKNDPIDGERGVIINTASIAAYEGQMGQAAYSASKAGIAGMTLPIARDLASYNIRVNTIVPGLIHTPLFDSGSQAVIDSLSAQVLNPRRLGRPEEVAHLATCLVENAYINGECIRIDGGIRMQAK